MEIFIALLVLISAVSSLVFFKSLKTITETDNISAARARANKRSKEMKCINNKPVVDAWGQRLNINASGADINDDRHDGRGPLTDDQRRIVDTLLNDVDINSIDVVDRSGYVFSKDNITKYPNTSR